MLRGARIKTERLRDVGARFWTPGHTYRTLGPTDDAECLKAIPLHGCTSFDVREVCEGGVG